MIVTVGDASPRQARGHIGDGCVKWEHLLNDVADVADQTGTVRGRIERVEMSLKRGFYMIITVIVSICHRLIGDTSPKRRRLLRSYVNQALRYLFWNNPKRSNLRAGSSDSFSIYWRRGQSEKTSRACTQAKRQISEKTSYTFVENPEKFFKNPRVTITFERQILPRISVKNCTNSQEMIFWKPQ